MPVGEPGYRKMMHYTFSIRPGRRENGRKVSNRSADGLPFTDPNRSVRLLGFALIE